MSEKRRSARYEMDMTQGSLLAQVLLFSFPLMLSSILQLLFNAADVVVVGRFDGQEALAAVGSTGALTNLIVNLFLGLSVGANVIIARYFAARSYKDVSEAVHTSVAVSVFGGVILAVFGYIMSGTFLRWMDSPEDVLPLATRYMQIIFLGMPFNMLYNFGAAVLRSIGDTRRPLMYLTIAGVVNVLLNLFFVIVFHMGVAGVALATILSQGISSALVLICLLRSEGAVRVDLRRLRIHPGKLWEIARIGVPAGLQGMCFSLSNVVIQSTVNSFGTAAVAGNSAAANIEGFVYVSMNALHQAAVTFTSQNLGAQKFVRIRKAAIVCVGTVAAVGFGLGMLALAGRFPLLGLYTTSDEVVEKALIRMRIIMPTYFLCGVMDVLCGSLRGLGKTMMPMLVSVAGACAFRILWIMLILPMNRSMEMLYYSYPASWALTALIHLICLLRELRKVPKRDF